MTKAKRRALSAKTRFEIFKRDSFKCQYCGKSAPDVILHVDHIHPVAKGGTNEYVNLITSCQECNSGKSDKLLDDNSEIEKQRKLLDELNERRMQLELMMKWREGLSSIEEEKLDIAVDTWRDHSHYSLNESGLKTMKRILKKYGLPIILDSIEAASDQYIKYDSEDKPTHDSVEKAFKMVERIAKQKLNPMSEDLKQIYYIRGILKNRLSYINEYRALDGLKKANKDGVSIDELKELALEVRNWSDFVEKLNEKGEYI